MEHAGEDAIVMAAGTGGGSGVRSDGLLNRAAWRRFLRAERLMDAGLKGGGEPGMVSAP